MPFSGCKECDRLWEAFANATFKRIRAENALNIALASYLEHDVVLPLKSDLQAIVHAVDELQDEIAQHEHARHNGQQTI